MGEKAKNGLEVLVISSKHSGHRKHRKLTLAAKGDNTIKIPDRVGAKKAPFGGGEKKHHSQS